MITGFYTSIFLNIRRKQTYPKYDSSEYYDSYVKFFFQAGQSSDTILYPGIQ